jgi:hypothetical protein
VSVLENTGDDVNAKRTCHRDETVKIEGKWELTCVATYATEAGVTRVIP